MERSSGIILHLTSLPSPCGIGDLGSEAYRFADFLASAGQKCWQILPVGPTGYGASPYQTLSALAGNPLFISLEALADQGWLTEKQLRRAREGHDPEKVDFSRQETEKMEILHTAYAEFSQKPPEDYAAFCRAEADWLEDYALFRALGEHFGGASWQNWEPCARKRSPEALSAYRTLLAKETDFHRFTQYIFFSQWEKWHSYVRARGIRIIGDIPIYVPLDSADVWAMPEQFLLTPSLRPRVVAGCPPDDFSADGQRWGNPIYDWNAMEKDGFSWWMRRVGMAARLFDTVRIDHFRGIESYWAIPARNRTARAGAWVPGPGMKLIGAIRERFPQTEFIAEDLGFLTKKVRKLVRDSGFPGMKVLEFAFSANGGNEYVPGKCRGNCVCYTGTHDNMTLPQWVEACDSGTERYTRHYLHIGQKDDLAAALLRAGMDCGADLFMAQMQDWLGLGAEARMNEPGTVNDRNWCWRMLPGVADAALANRLRGMTERAGRCEKEETT